MELLTMFSFYILNFFIFYNDVVHGQTLSCDVQIDNTCFKIGSSQLTFSEAEISCFNKKGTLALVDSPEKIRAITNILNNKNVSQAFFGVTDRAQKGTFRWINQSTLLDEGLITPGAWSEQNVDSCLVLSSKGEWMKASCYIPNQYICQTVNGKIADPPSEIWTQWVSMDQPSISDQILTVENLKKTYPFVCPDPYDVQCQVVGFSITSNNTGDTFQMPCSKMGLICINSDQVNSSQCQFYQLRFLCPLDINECTTKGLSKCDPNAQCINTFGSYKCVCNSGFNGDGKTCYEINQCVAWGDPHYVSFDNVVHHFMGICSYRLAETCFNNKSSTNQLLPFQITTSNEHRGINMAVSFTKSVTFHFYNLSVELNENNILLIDGLTISPPQTRIINNVQVDIIYATNGIKIQTSFGVNILFDGVSRVTVLVPSTYANQMCGMCGNMNGNPNDEWLLSNGGQTNDGNLWGNSWMAAIQEETNCALLNVSLQSNHCDDKSDRTAQADCGVLLSSDGPFSGCHGLIDPQTIYPSCYFDMCSDPENQDLLCSAYEMYAEQCAAVEIFLDWRQQTGCVIKCGANEHYQSQTSGCQASCSDPYAENSCHLRDTSGCICNDGYLRSGIVCKPKEQCGCYDGNNNYKVVGDIWYSDICSTKNTCSGTNTIISDTNIQCHTYGECFNTSYVGESECRCKKGFEGRADNCTDIDECALGSYVCSSVGNCINTLGSYNCVCNTGFSGDGLNCTDINECSIGTSKCSSYASCKNTFGSYLCTCENGFVGNGLTCSVKPIIAVNSDQENCSFHQDATCDPLSKCIDLPNGGFSCNCIEGTFGDGLLGANQTGCNYIPCPQNSSSFQGYCYQFTSNSVNQSQNEEICTNAGGHLATFIDTISLNFITEQLEIFKLTTSYYIGYSALRYKNFYLANDYSQLILDNWATGHPISGLSCVVILRSSANEMYKFKSVNCNETYPSICKFPSSPRNCSQGWTHIGNNCVTLVQSPINVTDAMITCARFEGDLSVIQSSDKSNIIFNSLLKLKTGKFWFGLNKNLLQRSPTAQWSNSSNVDFTNYNMPLSTSNIGMFPDIECYQILSTGKWVGTNCSAIADGFLCEKPQNVFYRCPTLSEYFNGQCYKTVPNDTQPNTQSLCSNSGGELVSISTFGEQIFLQNYLYSLGIWNSYWIGLEENLDHSSIYFWTDNSQYEYTNWGVNEPGSPGDGNCVIVDGSHFNNLPWSERNCNLNYPGLCKYENSPCQNDSNCNINGQCHLGQCHCKTGYKGDGLINCTNINECTGRVFPCNINENCTDTPGSFICTCIYNYVRLNNGTCENKIFCLGDADCAKNGKCFQNLCSCNIGFEGNGKLKCKNIDECLVPNLNNCNESAICKDLTGSYSCTCKNGYQGNGTNDCHPYPKTCHEYLLQYPNSPSAVYSIDPDFTGPLTPIDVTCDMRPNIGVTIISHDNISPKQIVNPQPYSENRTINYEFPLNYLIPIINASNFCYQNMEFQCQGFLSLMNTTSYFDVLGKEHRKWGSSVTENQCGCGEINICGSLSKPCFCDGSYNYLTYDTGRIINKSLLPLTRILTGGVGYYRSGAISIGALTCAPKPIDMPKTCDDAKVNYKLIKNGVTWLDVDGDGSLDPIRAMCDVTTKPFGVTIIPHDKYPGSQTPTTPTTFPGPLNSSPNNTNKPNPSTCLNYPSINSAILKLINNSGGCIQEVKYDCQVGSQLLNKKAYLTSLSGQNLDYFGSGSNGNCACGVYGSCQNLSSNCNCDGQNSGSDFGFIYKSQDLPIKCFVDNNNNPNPSKIVVGPLMCAPGPFGMEPSCHRWMNRGYLANYTYLIDTDGGNVNNDSKNMDAFLVICQMLPNPPRGVTKIPSQQTGPSCVNQTNRLCKNPVTYPLTPTQIKPILDRSSFCQQKIKYTCQIMTLLTPYSGKKTPYSFWRKYGLEDKNINLTYFAGNGTRKKICYCGLTGDCKTCFCDIASNVTKIDEGFLIEKSDLPVGAVWVGQDPSVTSLISHIEIGYLECYETFPTCEYFISNFITTTEMKLFYNTYYTVDPDGPFGELPIIVYCIGSKTYLYPNMPPISIDDKNKTNIGPKSQCVNITYENSPNPKQLKKLTSLSNSCLQYMKLNCQATPLTNYVEWYDIDGITRPGWAGNSDGKECACGEVDSCQGGKNFSCNCDVISSDLLYDHGLLVNKDILPVSKICLGLTEKIPPSQVQRKISINISPLICGPVPYDIYPDCQLLRENQYQDEFRSVDPKSEAWIIDPDGTGSGKPFTVYCDMKVDTPVGITVINLQTNPSLCSNSSLLMDKATINITYLAANQDNIKTLITTSAYCEQEVSYDCNKSPLFDGNSFGAYDYTNQYIPYWLGPNDRHSCTNNTCNCALIDDKMHSDSGKFTNKSRLPISNIVVPSVKGQRMLCVSPLKCYNLPRTCEEYNKLKRLDSNKGNRNNIWGIDPDQAGGEEFFGVLCKTVSNTIVTESLQTSNPQIINSTIPTMPSNISYIGTNMKQLHLLANVSTYCSQKIDYFCIKSGTLHNNDPIFIDVNNHPIMTWVGADLYNATGSCACNIMGICPINQTCRCDALTNSRQYEGGLFTDKNILPIKQINYTRGQNIQATIYPMDCASSPFGLPKDCIEARTQGYTEDTEVLIRPAGVLNPFLVSCKMKEGPNHNMQITIIPVIPNNQSNVVLYSTASAKDIKALVNISGYCLQSMRMTCNGIMFSSIFSWYDSSYIQRKNFGTNNPNIFCNCGLTNGCAAIPGESRNLMQARKCSCDSPSFNDIRYDSTIITDKTFLPITSVSFSSPVSAANSNIMKIGALMCSNTKFDFDECANDFDDCSPHANCTNIPHSFTCTCLVGWQGLGGNEMYSNGRSCIDDNECVLLKCPVVSDCVNTPGSFICNCHVGFVKKSQTKCDDINECAVNSSICDKNANCVNTYGSYICTCNPGYRGSGQPGDCEAVATCGCWGDPHCLSFDGSWLHYQGLCKYTLVRDKCKNGLPQDSSAPNFEVIMKNWDQNQNFNMMVSWAKEITVKLLDYTIIMKLGFILVVNGQKTSIPFSPKYTNGTSLGLEVSFYGNYLRLTTLSGLEVKWDGISLIDVTVTSNLQSKLCGLCGNYNLNPNDDWIIGPKCGASGKITDLLNLFGDSWKNDDPIDTDPACSSKICQNTPNEKPCAPNIQTNAVLECQKLKTIFANCEKAMEKFGKSLNDYLDSCVYDQCHATGDATEMMCKTAESLAQKCFEEYKINVTFRSENFCNMKCVDNMIYSPCANPCQPTCLNNSDSRLCSGSCVEGCICVAGFVMNNGNCTKPENCGCLMSDGTYFTDGEKRTNEICTEICGCNRQMGQLECFNITCSNDAFCDFKDDDYGCHCKNGFMGDGINCTDINECDIKPSLCHKNAWCNNTIGSYSCSCKEGFEGNGISCTNINECSPLSPCQNITEECFDQIPGYQCLCSNGFIKNITTGKCDDKNECADTGNLCDRVSTTCNNTFGNYRCDCKYGFRPSPRDSFVCTDVNECNLVHECDKKYAKCTNTPGSYYCTCNYGYQGDGRNCTDIDECITHKVCQRPDSTCVNLPGSYECRCLDGEPGCDGDNPCNQINCTKANEICYLGICECEQGYNRNDSTGQCEDIDECKSGENDCAERKASCSNLDGSYECECLYGYQMSIQNNTCENVNECTDNLHRCGDHAECVDTNGGYYCQCQNGFTGHCEECRDIDECTLSMNMCDHYHGSCENSIGSYRCKCDDGYSGEGSICNDLDECFLGLHNCTNSKEYCFNTDGSYQCLCIQGYQKNNDDSCEDENECLYADNGCDNNADCVNKNATFDCICKPGYTGSGKTCTPQDGYEQCGKTLCTLNAQCNNGSCTCKTGYTQSGDKCIDIDDCKIQTTCDINANCVNTPGSFVCYCKDGYNGNGYNCFVKTTDVDVCKTDSFCIDGDCYDGVCHCPPGFSYKSNRCLDQRCKNACPSNAICSTNSGSVVCSCSIGTTLSSDNSECTDIDECYENMDDCQENSICINQYGSYNCKCASGYLDVFGDGKICKYIKPSEDCQNKCPTGQLCTNGNCSCLPGLTTTTTDGNITCNKDSNSCIPGLCPLNSVCEERLFGYLCYCPPGHEGVGKKSCNDIDECSRNNHNCSRNEDCTNLPGTFSCSCKTGFLRDTNSSSCKSIKKCNCGPSGLCGSDSKCICKPGYNVNSNGICDDIDECSTQSPCHILAECINTPGSYQCKCPDKYFGDPNINCIENKCLTKTLQCQVGEHCVQSLYGSVCQKKTCNSTDQLLDDECVPVSKICQSMNCGQNAVCRIENGRPDCFCDSGYFGDGELCTNINECANGLVNCPENSRCQDKDGSFHCACNTGFTRSENSSPTEACKDIDECQISNSCAENALCNNSIGSFKCNCKTGYIGNALYNCQTDSKCERYHGCHEHASCTIDMQSSLYDCQCDSGYSGDGISSCTKDNLCFVNGQSKCHNNSKCSEVNGTYQCICPSGYKGDGYNFCNDIDECASANRHNCSSLEKCVNKNGHYSCECGPGAEIINNVCTDINECEGKGFSKCSPYAICNNTQGSYNCQCVKGFVGDGLICNDIDECKLGISNCTQNSLCQNKPGSFACECQAGFLGNGTTCGDIDECSKVKSSPGAPDCDENAICKNKNPGYTCECKPGYRGTGWFCIKDNPCNHPNACNINQTCTPSEDNSNFVCECKDDFTNKTNTCVPKQECVDGTDNCDRASMDCVQLDRGYKCACKAGFNAFGNTCKDKNECNPTSPDYAAQKCEASGGICSNTNGSFQCICQSHVMNSSCAGFNPCALELHDCNENTHKCVSNKDYSFTCSCKDGFQKNGTNCTDINECVDKPDSCKNQAICENTIGSFVCKCPDNLKLDYSNKSCIDRNECTENPMICSDHAKCVNVEGSYHCVCSIGYQWNGTHCEDIDECTNKTHPCHTSAECSNVPGSCKCKCKPGYSGDGVYVCSEVDTCPQKDDVRCPPGSYCNMVGEIIYCNCTNGYRDTKAMECIGDVCYNDCQDIDDCAKNKSICHDLATCDNTEGGYICKCPPYLVGNGKIQCEDENECALATHTCNENTSYCENLDNAVNILKPFQCHCFNGFVKIPETEMCVNKNECLNPSENTCVEDLTCIDTEGSFECECKPGFKEMPNKKCIDINECEDKTDSCTSTSICQNTMGSYVCNCSPGFLSSVNHIACDDINECKNPTTCANISNSICINNQGSFACVCSTGYSLQGGSCLDINDCLLPNTCGKNATCVNKDGGYNCTCNKEMRQLQNGDCELINECLENTDRCQELNGPTSSCYDLPVGYGCVCPKGYTNDPVFPDSCDDLNECQTNTHNCIAPNSTCVNSYGSFTCNCSSGYSKDSSGKCVDIDECILNDKLDLNICNAGTCKNTPGGHLCECPTGYSNDNNQCTDIDECSLDPVSSMAANCDRIDGDCVNTQGGYNCTCKKGYTMQSNSTKCQDIDECQFKNICINGLCNNLPGSFECICKKGFNQLNGKCFDKDECVETPTICGPPTGGICINTVGSYKCRCNMGYENSGNKSTNQCQIINECVKLKVICPPNAQCVDRSKGYECICKDGYQEDEIGICRNINECNIESTCNYLADCTDTDGSYKCTCKYGYKGDGKVQCKSICGPKSCPPSQICKVVNGDQYECGCQCQGAMCSENGQVCDNNGITYSSVKQLFETSCKQKLIADIDYYHECETSCDKVICPGTEICTMVKNKPTCDCEPCSVEDQKPGVICSSNGIQFQSICQLKTWICNTKYQISVSYESPCHRSIDCEISEWSGWSSCSKTCGIGRYSRHRNVLKMAVFNGKCDHLLEEVQQCYNGPCPGDACENKTCAPGSFCDHGKCICPDCSKLETFDPICGKIGDKESGTFRTFCTMIHNACTLDTPFTYIHQGLCGNHVPSEPKICTMVTNFQFVQSTDNCTSTEPVRTNLCNGGCGKNPNYCCRPLTSRILRSRFKCPDNSYVYREVTSISSCECKLEQSTTTILP